MLLFPSARCGSLSANQQDPKICHNFDTVRAIKSQYFHMVASHPGQHAIPRQMRTPGNKLLTKNDGFALKNKDWICIPQPVESERFCLIPRFSGVLLDLLQARGVTFADEFFVLFGDPAKRLFGIAAFDLVSHLGEDPRRAAVVDNLDILRGDNRLVDEIGHCNQKDTPGHAKDESESLVQPAKGGALHQRREERGG